tara:strand:+ start:328 stop:798 length:471 start_codon:yes stop_codon:yes gene_type:complete
MFEWLPFALTSTLGVGTYNLSLEGSGKYIGKDPYAKMTMITMILLVTGIISIFFMYGFKTFKPKSFNRAFEVANKDKWRIFIPGFILSVYMMTNILALSLGGGIVMGIINLNIFVTLLGGVYLYNDKIDKTVIILLSIAMILIFYASYHSSKLNSK